MNIKLIAPYLDDPLVTFGFILFFCFGLSRTFLKAEFIPQLTQSGGYKAALRFITYGVVLALAIIVVGLALQHRELAARERTGVYALGAPCLMASVLAQR